MSAEPALKRFPARLAVFGEAALLVAIWLAAIAFARPRGNFPVDDDWDFALATWRFAETGHFHFTAFTAVSLRAQVLWGALWTQLLGESFDVLRVSTLILAAATLLVVHGTLRRAGVPGFGRVIATLALAFHPIFFWSSCSFMTEVPFVFASAVALACFIRGFGERSSTDAAAPRWMGAVWISAGCAAAMTACFVRQTGITLLAAPLLLALLRRRPREAALIGATIALFGTIFVVRPGWLSGSLAEFAVHFKMWTEETFRLPDQLAVLDHYATFNAQNCALFFLPLVAPLAYLFVKHARRSDFVIAGVSAVVLFARVQSLVSVGLPMPYFTARYCCDVFAGNLFADLGLGPLALAGVYPFRLADSARLVLTYASVVTAALLLWAVLRRAARTDASLLALGAALFGSLALFGSGLYVDRYSLDSAWALVIALPLLMPWHARTVRVVSVAALLGVAAFSVLATQEYFAWNRARWQAIDDLRGRGVPITSINAGAEPFYLYELSQADQRMRRLYQFGVPDRPYTVAFEPLPGRSIIARYPYQGWLGRHRANVYVLHDAPGPLAPSPR